MHVNQRHLTLVEAVPAETVTAAEVSEAGQHVVTSEDVDWSPSAHRRACLAAALVFEFAGLLLLLLPHAGEEILIFGVGCTVFAYAASRALQYWRSYRRSYQQSGPESHRD